MRNLKKQRGESKRLPRISAEIYSSFAKIAQITPTIVKARDLCMCNPRDSINRQTTYRQRTPRILSEKSNDERINENVWEYCKEIFEDENMY